MSGLSNVVEQIRGYDLERALGLRPAPPRVALVLDRTEFSLVQVKSARAGQPVLEDFRVQSLDRPGVPATLFDQELIEMKVLSEGFQRLFDGIGTRPGRVAVVLPDNLAKISLISLPERPPSRRQLDEVVRFKMRRAVPFRLDDASLSYQVLSTARDNLQVLVAVARKAVVERYESALQAIGARPGRIDLCTPNVLNLCQAQIKQAEAAGGDVGLLNCTRNYFSLVLVRKGRLIFFRCKSYAIGDPDPQLVGGLLAREISSSFSYYEEKLNGKGVGTLLMRNSGVPAEQVTGALAALPVERLEPIDPVSPIRMIEGRKLEPDVAQSLAPALGAVFGGA